MLMLSRKTNEAIVIGDDICVTITHIGRGRVQIAVEAPREVRVRRRELLSTAPVQAATTRVASAIDYQDSATVVA